MCGDTICPNCRSGRLRLFHTMKAVPVNSCLLLSSREEAAHFPRGDLALGFCHDCGFVSNTAFDPQLTEYSERYEETQGFSGTFQAFHRELAQRLIDRYDLHERTVLEIGCGKGEFLLLLCEMGGNAGIGFDPAYIPERSSGRALERVTFVRDFYSEKYRDRAADFVVCKMTLEHIHQTGDFVQMVSRAVADSRQTVVFFQVPDATRIFRDCAFEDIYYEHCSYFSPASLSRLFRSNGFRILRIDSEYDGQYLTIEARPETGAPAGPDPGLDLQRLQEVIERFPTDFGRKVAYWRELLADLQRRRQRVVLWGSGSKAVSFLSTLGAGDAIAFAVDINPHRSGYFMPGTAHEIVSPGFLTENRPDTVIIMNPIYRAEIAAELHSLKLAPQILTL